MKSYDIVASTSERSELQRDGSNGMSDLPKMAAQSSSTGQPSPPRIKTKRTTKDPNRILQLKVRRARISPCRS